MGSINIQKQEISTILEMIAEQTETILGYKEGQIPKIELDIIRENIRRLYNNYSIIDKINSQIVDRLAHDYVSSEIALESKAKEIIQTTDDEDVSAITPEKKTEVNPMNAISEIYTKTPVEAPIEKKEEIKIAENPAPVEIIEETILEDKITEIIPEELPKEEAKQLQIKEEVKPIETIIPKPVIEQKSTPKHKSNLACSGNLFENSVSVADAYKDNKTSLHEKIGSSKTDNSLAGKLQHTPITDLVKSIGINDKFLFIKELFKNNGEDYNEAIQLLNNFSSLSQAFDYLEVLTQNYNWDESSNASLKLFDLVRRKFQN